jgi:hypothetical protein
MRMKFALALSLAAAALLQGCVPHLRSLKEEKFFHFPTSEAPWQTLTNGVDLHWWFQCYKGQNDGGADCHTMNLVALDRGVKPNWRAMPRPGESNWILNEFRHIDPVLSAHSGTMRRVIGVSTNTTGRTDIYVLRYSAGEIAKLEPAQRASVVDTLDVWHNILCLDGQLPVPRLVVEDERFVWIFADVEPRCGSGRADWRAPADMMAFDRPERFADLLHKPMQLFYLERDKQDEADFRAPRLVSSDAALAARRPRTVVALDRVPVPTGKVFALDYGQFHAPLRAAPAANMRCRYSETRLYMTIYEDTPNLTLDNCMPLSAERRAPGAVHQAIPSERPGR